MIRHLRITDLPSLIKLRRSSTYGLAYPATPAILGIIKLFPVFRYLLLIFFFRDWRNCWVNSNEAGITGLIRVQPKVSGAALEVVDLFAAQRESEVITDLLEDISGPAIQSGALKILIRIPQGKDIFLDVRRAGFKPLWHEIVYKIPSQNLTQNDIFQHEPHTEWSQLTDFDREHAFRLFCSTTPVFARSILGPTIEDWLAYEETLPKPTQDVCIKEKRSEGLSSRLSISTIGKNRFFRLISKYDYKNSLNEIIGRVMEETETYPLYTIANNYESNLIAALDQFGFTPIAKYDLMIKTLTERVLTSNNALISARQ